MRDSFQVVFEGFSVALYLFAFVGIGELSHYVISFFWLLAMFCINNVAFESGGRG